MLLGLLDPYQDPSPLVRGMDPDPDPSMYHPAKIVRKTLIHTILLILFDFLCFTNDVNVGYLQKIISRKKYLKSSFFVGMTKIGGSGSISQKAWIRGSGSTPKCHDPQQCKSKQVPSLIISA
jgi:hypothetical protein